MQHKGYICEKGSTHGNLLNVSARYARKRIDSREILYRLVLDEPADVNYFLILFMRVNGHRHIIICGDDLDPPMSFLG